jgi:hypothetical protein
MLLYLWTPIPTAISHIQTLQCHFNPSDVTITYTLPTTPIKKRKILCTSFRRPCKTLYHFNLTHTVLLCVIRPCPLYINLDTLCYTLFYCILLIILRFSSCFISFTLISLDLLLPTLDYILQTTSLFNIPLSNLY